MHSQIVTDLLSVVLHLIWLAAYVIRRMNPTRFEVTVRICGIASLSLKLEGQDERKLRQLDSPSSAEDMTM